MVTGSPPRKWVYAFTEGDATMRDLLGGKGAGLAEMTRAGLPVPPGFTITTEACNAYTAAGAQFPDGMWEQTLAAMKVVEQETGKRFGDPANPLLVSVRSGARFSMPGMMDTVLNLGLNQDTLHGLIALTGNERFGYDAYRRFIQMYGKIVLGIDPRRFEEALEARKHAAGVTLDTDLTADDLRQVVASFLEIVRQETGRDFPSDPYEQLALAIRAVFASWNSERAIAYRNYEKIPHDLGTAVNICTMVFGNMGNDSGTGVAFTRNPATGEKVLYGEYLPNAQGEDVVAGIRTPKKIDQLRQDFPEVYDEFVAIAQRLENHYRDAQDLEFTVERGRLYMLQTRAAKRTAAAAVAMAVDMAHEGLITREEAIQRVDPQQIVTLLLPRFDPAAKEQAQAAGNLLATGLNASPGAATGKAVFTADKAEELGNAGVPVILVRPETNPDDVHGMLAAKGILTAKGGATSHAAVVARGLGKPCVSGCEALHVDEDAGTFTVDGRTISELDEISIDGTTGEVFAGYIETIETSFADQPKLTELLSWADGVRTLGVWANADYPRDAAKAREFGAEGIGLCRTEHMFFEEERLPIVQDMILAAASAAEAAEKAALLPQAERDQYLASHTAYQRYSSALEQLERFQTSDFEGIFRAMEGRPVVIRLIDPPLHEFLPSHDELLEEVTELRVRGTDPARLQEREALLRAVEQMREANPMLGLRGCRLGILYPAINEMQVRAILTAAAALITQGQAARPEIMIPLVGHANELKVLRERLTATADTVMAGLGCQVPYRFGTMIEIPRAALTADEVAEHAEFFSFGTNDLTQTTFGYSRDDAEGKFLLQYVERKILPANPFQTLDIKGVGKLVEMGTTLGRQTRPDLKVGICGEHGGDPDSIAFCNRIGLDYVSCSPFRVPIARLAAAQAALAYNAATRDR